MCEIGEVWLDSSATREYRHLYKEFIFMLTPSTCPLLSLTSWRDGASCDDTTHQLSSLKDDWIRINNTEWDASIAN
jgi:hypothetical protein